MSILLNPVLASVVVLCVLCLCKLNVLMSLIISALTGAVLAGISIPDDVKCVIPHQANIRIIQAVAKRIGISEEQVICNIERYGNTSAASVAIGLDEAVRTGKLQRGDLALLASFGSGLVWGAQLLRY